MSTNYYYGASQGLVNGGSEVRLIVKLLVFLLLVSCLQTFKLPDVILALPVLYIAIFPTLFLNKLDPAYRQAINLVFCLPLLLLKWEDVNLRSLFRYLTNFIIIVNIFIYIVSSDVRLFDNNAFVGSFGNPNSVGIVSSFIILFSFIYESKIIRVCFVCLSIFFSVISGSMLSVVLTSFALFWIQKKTMKVLLFFLTLTSVSALSFFFETVVNSSWVPLSVSHVLNKFNGLKNFVLSGDFVGAHSIDNRVMFYQDAMSRLNTPFSIIFGHTDFTEVYFTGDGALIGYLATHGLPLTLFFLLSVLYCVVAALSSNCKITRQAGIMLLLIAISLLSNRLLDYWPIGLLFCMVFGICRSTNLHSQGKLTC